MILALCRNARTDCGGPRRDDLTGCHWGRYQCCHGVVEHSMLCSECLAGRTPSALWAEHKSTLSGVAANQRAREAARPTVGRAPPPTRGTLMLPRARPERAPRTGRTPEALVLDEVRRVLDSADDLVWWRQSVGLARTASGGVMRYGEAGQSDIMGVLAPRGRFVALEVKSAAGRVSPAQHAWLTRMAAQGACVGVVRSGAEALALLERARAMC